jgi:hypothetical protein
VSLIRLALLAAVLWAGLAGGQPVGPVVPAVRDLDARLAALRPEQPGAYYELGEEVAGEGVGPEDFAVARQLYLFAYELDRASGSRLGLGPSVCLALAKIERLDEVRDWLRATAGTLDPRYVSTDWNVAAQPKASDQTALKAAEVLGLTRSGDGGEAIKRLEEAGVRDLLVRYDPLLSQNGQTGGLSNLESQMRAWPCPECKNRRYVTRVGRDGPEIEVCSTCGGNPGPELSQEALIAHLRFESRVLSGLQRSWSAQVASDYGSPLLDPDPAQLAETLRSRYGLVLGKPYWRDGRWVESPEGPVELPVGPPEPAPAPRTGTPDSAGAP